MNQIFSHSKKLTRKIHFFFFNSNIIQFGLIIVIFKRAPINCLITIDNWLIASADDDGTIKVKFRVSCRATQGEKGAFSQVQACRT